MNFDDILLEIIESFVSDKNIDIEAYCKKYPQHKDAIRAKFGVAKFLNQSFQETDLSGKKLGDYLLLQELGRGGMGVVFLGINPALSRLSAIKVLPPSFSSDKEALTNFQNEARTIAKFNHPNIVPIYSINNEKGVHYISMGYIPGPSIKDTIEKLQKIKDHHRLKALTIKDMLQTVRFDEKDISQKSISLKRGVKFWDMSYYRFIATIGAEIANALSCAHQNSIFHGDIKPSNILLTNEAMPMVVDFGLSKDLKKLSSSKSNEFSGTLAYASPEQIKKNTINDKTDIWSLGVTLYELLTFNNPFREKTVKKTVDNILKAFPPLLRHYNKKIPKDLEAIVLKCLEPLPQDRYDTIENLATDLKNHILHKPTKAKPVNLVARTIKWVKRNPIKSLLICFLLILTPFTSMFYSRYAAHRLIGQGNQDYGSGYYSKAIVKAKKALAVLRYNKSALCLIGDGYYGLGEYNKSLQYYFMILDKEKENTEAGDFFNLGIVYLDLMEFDKSELYFKKAFALSPKDRIICFYLGCVYEEKKQYDSALLCFANALLLGPQDLRIASDLHYSIKEHTKIKSYNTLKNYLKKRQFCNDDVNTIVNALKKISPNNL